MWTNINNTEYYISTTSDIEVYLTDFVAIWIASFSKASFLDCVKASNPDLETDDNDIVNCKTMLAHPEHLKSERTTIVNDGKSLNMYVMGDKAKFGYPLHLQINLQEGNKELFFRRVTQPLLSTVENLRASEKSLMLLLEKKDKEIEEYKCEGGEIALRHLKTVPFDLKSHEKAYNMYDNTFGPQQIAKNLLTKTVKTLTTDKIPTIGNVKSEPDSVSPIVKTEETSPNIQKRIKIEDVETSSQCINTPKRKLRKKLNI